MKDALKESQIANIIKDNQRIFNRWFRSERDPQYRLKIPQKALGIFIPAKLYPSVLNPENIRIDNVEGVSTEKDSELDWLTLVVVHSSGKEKFFKIFEDIFTPTEKIMIAKRERGKTLKRIIRTKKKKSKN